MVFIIDNGEDCTFMVQVSWEMDICEAVELNLGDILETADHLVVTLEEEIKWLLLQSPRTGIFTSGDSYTMEMVFKWQDTQLLHW